VTKFGTNGPVSGPSGRADFSAIANSSTGGNGLSRPFGTFFGCRGSHGNALWLRLPENTIPLTRGLLQSAPIPKQFKTATPSVLQALKPDDLLRKTRIVSSGITGTVPCLKTSSGVAPRSQQKESTAASTSQRRHAQPLQRPPSKQKASRYSSYRWTEQHCKTNPTTAKLPCCCAVHLAVLTPCSSIERYLGVAPSFCNRINSCTAERAYGCQQFTAPAFPTSAAVIKRASEPVCLNSEALMKIRPFYESTRRAMMLKVR
jgi:hypothetical protein